ncbi:MAG TPA: Spy/CpxP family protein refolding chaperone [Rhizomicrobium sp.]
MRKALVPMLASLVLCGGATAALVVNARAAPTNTRKPMMVALVTPGAMLAQNSATPPGAREMRMPAEMTAHLKQMCEDRYAREAGRMAYLEARLKLTSAQQPLFARWKEAALDIAKRRGADCSQRVTQRDRKERNVVERMGREEEMLKRRIADLDAERPALGALYTALSSEQREALSPNRHRMAAGGTMVDDERFRHPPMEMGDHTPPPPPQ